MADRLPESLPPEGFQSNAWKPHTLSSCFASSLTTRLHPTSDAHYGLYILVVPCSQATNTIPEGGIPPTLPSHLRSQDRANRLIPDHTIVSSSLTSPGNRSTL